MVELRKCKLRIVSCTKVYSEQQVCGLYNRLRGDGFVFFIMHCALRIQTLPELVSGDSPPVPERFMLPNNNVYI